ncbi:MAG: hypothetical protein JNL56_01730 [Alphaproteobacteria bacterium]|nr:hypothetical protein [Alphaproteobacteria bacterium]
MLFLCRAVFWISVVAVFMPGDPAADAIVGSARATALTAADVAYDDSYQAVVDVCLASPDLCSSGANAIDDAQALAVAGLDALALVLTEDGAAASN